jgi:hypothetical protein
MDSLRKNLKKCAFTGFSYNFPSPNLHTSVEPLKERPKRDKISREARVKECA